MSDDWGGNVPLPEEDEGASSPKPAAPPSGPKKGRSNALIGGAVAAVVAVVVVVVLVAGGGGSNDKKKPTAHSTPVETATATATATDSGKLSKSEFISKASDICGQFHDDIISAGQAGNAQEVVSDVNQEIGEIRALGPPSEDESTISDALSAADASNRAQIAGDLVTAQQESARVASLLHQFGLDACNPSASP